jgi:phage terminase Nu1 subunit (DNA packaging protein)
MNGNRALFWHEHIGGNQFRLRIRNHLPGCFKQWFIFDRRTRSIRAWSRRSYAISGQRGYKFRIANAAVIRHFRNDNYQKVSYWNGHRKNVRNNSKQCLDIYHHRNHNNMHTVWYPCHNGANQGWFLDQRGIRYPRQPIRDGHKFQIKSRMRGKRALFYHEHIGGHQWRLRIRNNNPGEQKQWWVFDRRTRTIRAWADRSKCISNQRGYGFRTHRPVVIRRYQNHADQKIAFYGGHRRNIRNNANVCLDVAGGDRHHAHTHWYPCHNGLNQAWYLDQVGIRYPAQPLRDGVRFQIKSRMAGNKALIYWEHIGGHQYRLRIQENNPMNNKQWWVFDSRTKTVRAWKNRAFVIANQRG